MFVLPILIDGIIRNVEIAGIPHGQLGNPAIRFDPAGFDATPASGNQDEEYVKLDNPTDVAVDISGWRLSGGIEHTFRPGTIIPAGMSLYVSPNVRVFRARTAGPAGGQTLLVQGDYDGHLSGRGETIQLVAADGALVDSLVTPDESTDAQRFLRITEVHYNPRAWTTKPSSSNCRTSARGRRPGRSTCPASRSPMALVTRSSFLRAFSCARAVRPDREQCGRVPRSLSGGKSHADPGRIYGQPQQRG